MVERVKHFHAKLQVESVVGTKSIVLEERQIGIRHTWHSNISNRPRCVPNGEIRQLRENRGSEPLALGGMAELSALATPERPLAKSEQPSRVANTAQNNRRARRVFDDASCLPSSHDTVRLSS